MSSYAPPTENVAIFDSVNFTSGDETITQSQADKRYLRFPNAQGTENLQAINVNGIAQFNSNVNVGSSTTPNRTPLINTFNSDILVGNSGQGRMRVNCELQVPGFGVLTMSSSNINMTGAATIQQNPLAGSSNTLSTTTINAGVTGAAALTVTGNVNLSKPLTMTSATPTDRLINTAFLQLANEDSLASNAGIINGSGNSIYYELYNSAGTHIFRTTNGTTPSNTILLTNTDLTISTVNPPTCAASSTIALSDDSAKLPSTAWVRDYVASIPPPLSTGKTYTQVIMGNYQSPTNVLQFSPPAGTIKFDVTIVGTGGLASTGLASGGGAQVVTILGVLIPPYYGGSPVPTITIGTGASFISDPSKTGTYVGLANAFVFGSALDGNNAVGSTAGGATSGIGDLNSQYGTFSIYQGGAGGVGANVIGAGNVYGGIAGYPDPSVVSPSTGLNQYGQGQGSAAGSPINYGGAIFTWYLT
jgi:hypothetical protein